MPTLGVPDYAKGKNNFRDISMGGDSKGLSKKEIIERAAGYKAKGVVSLDGKNPTQMGKDEFLKILTHQLQNQDPSKPMDHDKFAAQLAQFS